uniref:Uncharacterized protein n=1 Tax=Kalanchoe fedtschenkoi TaxID=63787 RepID=A0A7N0ZSQ3_KALFE
MLLLGFLSLFLFSALTEGRRIGAEMKSKGNEGKFKPQVEQTEQQVRVAEEHELGEVESEGSDEVAVDMDYTPASRKSPVHN